MLSGRWFFYRYKDSLYCETKVMYNRYVEDSAMKLKIIIITFLLMLTIPTVCSADVIKYKTMGNVVKAWANTDYTDTSTGDSEKFWAVVQSFYGYERTLWYGLSSLSPKEVIVETKELDKLARALFSDYTGNLDYYLAHPNNSTCPYTEGSPVLMCVPAFDRQTISLIDFSETDDYATAIYELSVFGLVDSYKWSNDPYKTVRYTVQLVPLENCEPYFFTIKSITADTILNDDPYRDWKINIDVDKYTVKYRKKTTVNITSDSNVKLTVTPINSKAKNKKYVRILNGKKARIKFSKQAPKGKYKFKVTGPKQGQGSKLEKVITLRVK